MLLLPWAIWGDIELDCALIPYDENEGETLEVRIGDAVERVALEPGMKQYRFTFSALEGATSIGFSGFRAIAVPGARDHRTLGIGVRNLALRGLGGEMEPPPESEPLANRGKASEVDSLLSLSGTVYATMLNPADGRKNWEDIPPITRDI